MSELVLRANYNDHTVVAELLGPTGLPLRSSRKVHRLVVPATAAAANEQFSAAALDSAHQFLVDPLTPLVLDVQAPSDSWAQLPFATANPVPLSQVLTDQRWRNDFVAGVIDFQLSMGATALMPPYLHLDRATSAVADAQVQLWDTTQQILRAEGLSYPVLPVVSLDLSRVSLEPAAWDSGLGRLLGLASTMASGPVALALSASSRPTEHSLHKMARIWRRTRSLTEFLAWHAGDVGLLAVALGAAGYEVGMAAGERCNAPAEIRNRRPSATGPGPRWTGVYVDSLGRSIGKREFAEMSKVRSLQGDLGCVEPSCCPRGFDTLLGTGRRQHAVRSRLSDLVALDDVSALRWRLHHLERKTSDGLAVARRIRAHADKNALRVGVYPAEFEARLRVLQGLRATATAAVA